MRIVLSVFAKLSVILPTEFCKLGEVFNNCVNYLEERSPVLKKTDISKYMFF